jgi:hypothetical protein
MGCILQRAAIQRIEEVLYERGHISKIEGQPLHLIGGPTTTTTPAVELPKRGRPRKKIKVDAVPHVPLHAPGTSRIVSMPHMGSFPADPSKPLGQAQARPGPSKVKKPPVGNWRSVSSRLPQQASAGRSNGLAQTTASRIAALNATVLVRAPDPMTKDNAAAGSSNGAAQAVPTAAENTVARAESASPQKLVDKSPFCVVCGQRPNHQPADCPTVLAGPSR